MRVLLMLLVLLAAAVQAPAGQNPDIRVSLDFDPPNGVHRVDDPVNPLRVYVVCDCFGANGGLSGAVVSFERTFGAAGYQQVALITAPHGSFGDVEDPYMGWVMASVECVYPDAAGVVLIGYVDYWYIGPPGYLRIVPPDLEGGLVADCDVEVDEYCVFMNAGVGVDPPPGDPDCECGSIVPVEEGSWGAIKAIYR